MKKQRADGPLRVVSNDDRYCLLAGAAGGVVLFMSVLDGTGGVGRLVAAPVVVPLSVLARGVTSRMPGGAAGLAGVVCAL
jgi:hypothetical protein